MRETHPCEGSAAAMDPGSKWARCPECDTDTEVIGGRLIPHSVDVDPYQREVNRAGHYVASAVIARGRRVPDHQAAAFWLSRAVTAELEAARLAPPPPEGDDDEPF